MIEGAFGIPAGQYRRLLRLLQRCPSLRRVWIYGSRARGDHRPGSDVDLALDAPDLTDTELARLATGLEELNILFRVDLVHLQRDLDEVLRERIERDRRLFWEPGKQPAETA
ncbi:MAG: nucleotidyltransferase domain-containing protein [Betaproteobacteria bacterium]